MRNDNFKHANECKCLAWHPIFAGTLAAVGFAFLLNLFSIAIGLTAFTTNSTGVQSLALGGLLGTAIGIVASMFAAGWLAGYLGQRHCEARHLGGLYGFLTWCLALIVTIFLAAHVQQYISFYGHYLSGSTDAVVQMNHVAASAGRVAVSAGNVSAKSLMISTYILFSLFFLSAFACSLGGHCGMRHACNKSGTC